MAIIVAIAEFVFRQFISGLSLLFWEIFIIFSSLQLFVEPYNLLQHAERLFVNWA